LQFVRIEILPRLILATAQEVDGKILAGLNPEQQIQLAEQCVKRHWNVRKMELEAKKLQNINNNAGKYSDANIERLEILLSEHLGNRVQVNYEERGGGFVRIHFNNVDELEGYFDRIGFELEENT